MNIKWEQRAKVDVCILYMYAGRMVCDCVRVRASRHVRVRVYVCLYMCVDNYNSSSLNSAKLVLIILVFNMWYSAYMYKIHTKHLKCFGITVKTVDQHNVHITCAIMS